MAGERILIVEDEVDLAKLMATVMQKNGYQTDLAYEGVAGLNLALQDRPDLILLDLYLPQMDGIELLSRLDKEQVEIPVVVVTAFKSEQLAIEALRHGVKDYITKPFVLDELLDAVERALAEGRLRRERDALTGQLLASNQTLERQVRQLTALYEVGQALASTLDLDERLNVILGEASRVLEVSMASISLLDEQAGALVFRSVSGKQTEMLIGMRLEPGQGVAGWVAEHAEPLLACQAQSDPRFCPIFDEITGIVTDSILCVPLMTKGRVIGVVEALNKPEPGFTEDDMAMLRSLAASAAVSIENARLYQNLRESRDQVAEHSEALQKRLSELSRLQQMATELSKVTIGADPQDVFRRLTEHTAALLDAEYAAVMLFDPERDELICQEPAFGVPADVIRDYRVSLREDSPVRTIWASHEPFIVNKEMAAPLVRILGLEKLVERVAFHSTLYCTLRASGQPIGVLQVMNKRDNSDFTYDDGRVLEIFASQSAIAIENARILQRMEALNQVGEAITAHLTLPEILERVIQGINELIHVQGVSIWLKGLTANGGDAQLSLVASLPNTMDGLMLDPGEGIAGLVAQTGQPLIVHDAQNDPRCSRQVEELTGFTMESILCVPLQVRDETSGVIQVVNKIGAQFDQEDLEILSSVAASVAVAVENSRLFTSEKRRASEMEALVGIARAVTEAVTEQPKALLERIVRGACEVLDADCAVVYPFVASEPDTYDVTNLATFGTQHPLELGQSKLITRDPTQVVRKRNLLTCEDVACEQPALLQDPFFERESIRSFVGVLLKADEDEMGVLYVCFRARHCFEERELTAVRLIAHQAALAIAKSRLFQTLNRDLVRANADLRRKVRELEELQTINNLISSTLEMDNVWDQMLRGAMSITGAPCATILLKDEESGGVVAHVRRGDETFTHRVDPHETMILPVTTEATVYSAATQGSTKTPARGFPWLSTYWRLVPDARSVRHTPIVSGDSEEPIGLLVISSPRQGDFGPDDIRLLEALANQAAIAIQNARYLQAMRAYQEQQVETERIAAMADIAGNMIHRINNTVGAIRPLIQQIEMKLDRGHLSDEYLCEKLQSIRENADRTLEVARQIRRPFRPIRLENIDVNESIAAAWASLTAPVGVSVDIECGEDLPLVKATRQLDEVFRNLMRNALDAMADEGGSLRIRSRRISDRLVIVTVKDNGPGIPPQIREQVFHMGTTTKRGGMGYGLWWSRMFLRRLQGDIMLESGKGQGCMFTVTLPISET
jgi:GAF domain-containing protein/CheY-like chemotaxis protein